MSLAIEAREVKAHEAHTPQIADATDTAGEGGERDFELIPRDGRTPPITELGLDSAAAGDEPTPCDEILGA